MLDEQVRRLLDKGPDKDELLRAKTAFRAGFVRGIERIGGFGGKADALAECAVFTGDPGCFRTSLVTIASTRACDLKAVGRTWLGKGDHTLVVTPGERVALAEEPALQPTPLNPPSVDPTYRALPGVVDRSAGPPRTTAFPQLKFPALQRATLKNGTRLILAERHDVPVVQFRCQFPGGFSADQGRKSGTANFTMGMLDEGAGDYDALGFADAADPLGATLSAGASLDGSNASRSALKENVAPSLALYADMLRRPRFEQQEIARIKASWIAGIRQEKAQPNAAAMPVLPPLLYGAGHPYAIPWARPHRRRPGAEPCAAGAGRGRLPSAWGAATPGGVIANSAICGTIRVLSACGPPPCASRSRCSCSPVSLPAPGCRWRRRARPCACCRPGRRQPAARSAAR